MIEIDSYKSFEDNIINSSDLIVLDIYKTNCGQCKMMMPLIDKLSKKYNEEVSFYKINLDVVPEVADKYKVNQLPSIVFIQNGTFYDMISGGKTYSFLENKIISMKG